MLDFVLSMESTSLSLPPPPLPTAPSKAASGSLPPPPQPPLPHLVIGTVLLLAFAALEQVGGGAARLGHLVLTDSLLGHGVPQFPQLVAGHFLERKEFALQG